MQDTLVEPCVAVMVTVSPLAPLPAPTVGVITEVMLSVEERPSSEAESKTGAKGASGGVVSIVMVNGAEATEMLLSLSVRVVVIVHVPSLRGGSWHSESSADTT